MQLLLLLSALLSGLTGAMAGERRVEQARVERAAAEAVASVQAAVEAEAAALVSLPARVRELRSAQPVFLHAAPVRDVLSISEARLE